MKKIILYSAISLDGMIAKKDGDIQWLHETPNPDKTDHGYSEFIKSIDTTLMGNSTYQQVLGFDMPFPYTGFDNFVFTKNQELEKDENVNFVSKDLIDFVKDLKSKSGKDIWLIGGGKINTLLLNHNLVDKLMVYVMPVVLGPGIPLFNGTANFSNLQLTNSKTYSSGVVEIIYEIASQNSGSE